MDLSISKCIDTHCMNELKLLGLFFVFLVVLCSASTKLFSFPQPSSSMTASMAGLNQLMLLSKEQLPSSPQLLQQQQQLLANASVPPELQSNPYFQHMIENYSNIMHQNMSQQSRQQQQEQQLERQDDGPPPNTNQGPSWL